MYSNFETSNYIYFEIISKLYSYASNYTYNPFFLAIEFWIEIIIDNNK